MSLPYFKLKLNLFGQTLPLVVYQGESLDSVVQRVEELQTPPPGFSVKASIKASIEALLNQNVLKDKIKLKIQTFLNQKVATPAEPVEPAEAEQQIQACNQVKLKTTQNKIFSKINTIKVSQKPLILSKGRTCSTAKTEGLQGKIAKAKQLCSNCGQDDLAKILNEILAETKKINSTNRARNSSSAKTQTSQPPLFAKNTKNNHAKKPDVSSYRQLSKQKSTPTQNRFENTPSLPKKTGYYELSQKKQYNPNSTYKHVLEEQLVCPPREFAPLAEKKLNLQEHATRERELFDARSRQDGLQSPYKYERRQLFGSKVTEEEARLGGRRGEDLYIPSRQNHSLVANSRSTSPIKKYDYLSQFKPLN